MNASDIEKLASLSRLKLSVEEKEMLARDMDSILSYVSELPDMAAPESRPKPPLRNVLRDDGEPHATGMHTEALLAEAPKSEEGYVSVKPILTRDSLKKISPCSPSLRQVPGLQRGRFLLWILPRPASLR